MEFLTHLWLPILASAAAVWVASALAWMALPHHKGDSKALPDQDAFVAAIRSLKIPPGSYGFPDCKGGGRNDPKVQQLWKEGPLGMLSLWRPNPAMGPNMLLTFIVYLAVSSLIAYLGWSVLPHTGPIAAAMPEKATCNFGAVMRPLGTAGVLAYCFSFIPNAIWFQKGARSIFMNFIDGAVYGLITGAIFAALWPS